MSGILEKLVTSVSELAAEVAKNNELLTKIVAAGPGASADKPASTRGRKPKDADKGEDASDGADDATVDAEELTATRDKVAKWLKEFSEAGEDDPENAERSAKFSKALASLGVKKVSEITKESDRVRVEEWIEKMIAKKRLTGPLETKKAAAADDDI